MTDFPALFTDPQECQAAIEALKDLIVLGPWRRRNACNYDRMAHGRISAMPNIQYEEDEDFWYVQLGLPLERNCEFRGKRYETPELAMAAVDAHLSTMPNVRLINN